MIKTMCMKKRSERNLLRRLRKKISALAEDLRLAHLYDYEPQASADNYLVNVTPEDAHGRDNHAHRSH